MKNNKKRVRFKCKSEHDCGWYIYAVVMDDGIGFQIRGMKLSHTCLFYSQIKELMLSAVPRNMLESSNTNFRQAKES